MGQGWVTTLLLAFGIVVGIIGVVAYLRMLRKEKGAATDQSITESSSSDALSGEHESNSEGESTKVT